MNAQAQRVAEVEDSWNARGFRCQEQQTPAGKIVRDDVRDTDELIMVIEGDVEVEMGAKTLHPTKGEELLIPAWVAHTIRNIGTSSSRWLRGLECDYAQTD